MDFASRDALKKLVQFSYIEGISLLLLFFVAMPIKYMAGYPIAVSIVGMLHGLLFMGLVFFIFMVANANKWPKTMLIFALVTSTIPFGMIALDRKIKAMAAA